MGVFTRLKISIFTVKGLPRGLRRISMEISYKKIYKIIAENTPFSTAICEKVAGCFIMLHIPQEREFFRLSNRPNAEAESCSAL